jgi:D-beta-D-heptose 7-phosphate kinase/D-beta-D-heptose 1-phosphate adenosyltransferase
MNKISTLDPLLHLRPAWRAGGSTLVFTNGVFDLLHLGHVRYLQEARALGDVLVVGLNSDASVRRLKGPARPLVPQAERAELLAALACVDHLVIYDTDTAEHLVASLRPEVYVKGGDYARAAAADSAAATSSPPKPLPEAEVVKAYGGRVVLVPYLAGYSTTELIDRILRNNGR